MTENETVPATADLAGIDARFDRIKSYIERSSRSLVFANGLVADQDAIIAALQAENKRLREPFANIDDFDWQFLLSKLGDGGRDRFWKSRIAAIRAALEPKP